MQKLCIRLVGCLTAACLFLAIAGILQAGTASAHTSIHVAHTAIQSWRYPHRHYYGRHVRIYGVNMDNCDCGGNQGYYINYVTVPSYPSTNACDSCSNSAPSYPSTNACDSCSTSAPSYPSTNACDSCSTSAPSYPSACSYCNSASSSAPNTTPSATPSPTPSATPSTTTYQDVTNKVTTTK